VTRKITAATAVTFAPSPQREPRSAEQISRHVDPLGFAVLAFIERDVKHAILEPRLYVSLVNVWREGEAADIALNAALAKQEVSLLLALLLLALTSLLTLLARPPLLG
jgi:hypothetical protein